MYRDIRKIKTIKPSFKEQNVGDGGGLWLRVQPIGKGGAKSFYFRYTHGRKQKRFTFGQYPGLSLADARSRRNDAREAIALGRDPAKFSGASRDAYTVRELAELWRDTVLCDHADEGDKIMRALEKDVLKSIGDQAVTTVTYDQIVQILEEIVDREAKTQSSKLLSHIRQMFAFGVRRQLLRADPVAGIRSKDVGAGEKSRDRHLSWGELDQLAVQMKNSGLAEHVEAALWILLLTGVRPIELRFAKTKHLDFERKEWVLPKTKNNSEHLVHLSSFSVRMFKVLLKYSTDGWLLPGSKPKEPVSESFLRKIIGDRIGTVNRKEYKKSKKTKKIKITNKSTEFYGTLALSGGPWRLQDCRRTMATRMGDLGVAPEVIDAALNHKMKGVTGVYQRQAYLQERKHAFNLWGKKLEEIISSQQDL
jgi:integrase